MLEFTNVCGTKILCFAFLFLACINNSLNKSEENVGEGETEKAECFLFISSWKQKGNFFLPGVLLVIAGN